MDFRLKTVKENKPELKLDREWQYCLVSAAKPFPMVGYEGQLTQFQGKRLQTPRPFSGYYFGFKFSEWKIGQDHIWYDGPNCSWQFGPFVFQMCGIGDCKKCRDGA